MKKLSFALAAILGLCAFGSLAHAGTEYIEGNSQRTAPAQAEEPRTYVPLLPPLPFLPVPTLVFGGHGPAPAIVPIGGPTVVGGPGPVVAYGRPYHRRHWRRRFYGPGPGVAVGVGL